MQSAIISIQNLNKSYGTKKILDELNWEVKQGDIIALLGKNGAGKTTLLESIMSLREEDSGELQIWGKAWKDLEQKSREKIAFVSQDTIGFEWMKIDNFLSYLGEFFEGFDQDYCNQLLERWQLDTNQRVAELSGGQTQILHIIQALSVKPELLILDEPVAHLDPEMRRNFLAELVELTCEMNTTVIFSSHIVSDLERVANKIAFLKAGKIRYYYEIDELKTAIAHLKISEATEDLKTKPYFRDMINWHDFEGGMTASVVKPLEISIDELAASSQCKIESIPLSLEDWFLEISNATV